MKRFELRLCNNGIYYLWDNNELTDIDFDQFNKESANGIVDLLNELAEENEQLRKMIVQNDILVKTDYFREMMKILKELGYDDLYDRLNKTSLDMAVNGC